MDYWKILRVLTTNACNYKCFYCHNEGQDKVGNLTVLSYENFLKIMEGVKDTKIEEIRFSGGEPLMNKKTIDMIEWVDKNTEYEVGLATNGSLLDENIVQRLSKTRVMITLHFPGATLEEYKKVTSKDFKSFINCVELLEKYNIDYSFNYVLYPETIDNINDVILYAVNKNRRLKLLPYIENNFRNFSSEIIKKLNKIFDEKNWKKEYDTEYGITYWSFKNKILIKMIDSPCYEKNIKKCRAYGEIRLLPDMKFQSCIFGEKIDVVNINEISKQMDNLWEKFKECSWRE